jgi:hypothetical protein
MAAWGVAQQPTMPVIGLSTSVGRGECRCRGELSKVLARPALSKAAIKINSVMPDKIDRLPELAADLPVAEWRFAA